MIAGKKLTMMLNDEDHFHCRNMPTIPIQNKTASHNRNDQPVTSLLEKYSNMDRQFEQIREEAKMVELEIQNGKIRIGALLEERQEMKALQERTLIEHVELTDNLESALPGLHQVEEEAADALSKKEQAQVLLDGANLRSKDMLRGSMAEESKPTDPSTRTTEDEGSIRRILVLPSPRGTDTTTGLSASFSTNATLGNASESSSTLYSNILCCVPVSQIPFSFKNGTGLSFFRAVLAARAVRPRAARRHRHSGPKDRQP